MTLLHSTQLEELPAHCYVDGTVTIPAVSRRDIRAVHRDYIDMTSLSSPGPFRQVHTYVTVHRYSGVPLTMTEEEYKLALNGGGTFFVVKDNELHTRPFTRAEHRAERKRRIEALREMDRWNFY